MELGPNTIQHHRDLKGLSPEIPEIVISNMVTKCSNGHQNTWQLYFT